MAGNYFLLVYYLEPCECMHVFSNQHCYILALYQWLSICTSFTMHTALCVGGPAAPVPVLGVVNSSVLVLQWEAPFTWPYTSIHHYTITANNSLENWNQTVYTDTLVQIRASGRLTECTAYTFTVVANNEIADGIAGTVTGGFPIGKLYLAIMSTASPTKIYASMSINLSTFLRYKVAWSNKRRHLFAQCTCMLNASSGFQRERFQLESTSMRT